MKASLISGKTQPVDELWIVGHIKDGVCRAAFKATFKNKQDVPVETSFTFPLPAGVCSTSFKVNFHGQKMRSRVMRDDSARLEFDDTLAQADFAAMVQVDDNNEVEIDLGAMAPDEVCKVSIYFDVSLIPTSTGLLLLLPSSVTSFSDNLRAGVSPPPLQLKFDISDSLPIKSIAAPFSENSVVDQAKKTILCPSVNPTVPFHIAITYQNPPIGRCLFQKEGNRTFMQVVAKTPRCVRDHPSQFTVMFGATAALLAGPMTMVLRAIEYFIMSIPFGSRYNFAYFGHYGTALFDSPRELDLENRNLAISMLRQEEASPQAKSFADAQLHALENVKPEEMESVVIVIGTDLPADTTFIRGHQYFLIDPLGGPSVKVLAEKTGVTYIPVATEGEMASAILSPIKFTAGPPLTDVSILVDEKKFLLPPVQPGMIAASFLSVESTDVKSVRMTCGKIDVNIPMTQSPLPVIHHLWAYEKLKYASREEATEIALAGQILTPKTASIVAIERETEVEGEVYRMDSRLTKMGVAWVQSQEEEKGPEEHRREEERWAALHNLPYGAHHLMRVDPDPQPRGGEAPAKQLFVGKMNSSVNQQGAVEKRVAKPPPKPIVVKGGRKPFFLLRLIQLQNPDGSWTAERNLAVCCGFAIPEESMGLPRELFLTAFVLVCLNLKAKDSEDSWELVAEKGLLYLMDKMPGEDWDRRMAEIEAALTQ